MGRQARGEPPVRKTYKAEAGGKSFVIAEGPDGGQIVNGKPWDVRVLARGGLTLIWYKNALYRFRIERTEGNTCVVWSGHQLIEVEIEDERARLLAQFSATAAADHSHVDIVAPMPGLVTKIKVEVGQSVEKNGGLLSLEAMKMENEIRSPITGRIRSIHVAVGAKVDKGTKMIVVEPHQPVNPKSA
jgi:pyruvate carboxylase subunit B